MTSSQPQPKPPSSPLSPNLPTSCLYFSNPLPIPLSQSIFQQHLSTLQTTKIQILSQGLVVNLLIQRYYEIVKKYQEIKMEEVLVGRVVGLIGELVRVGGTSGEAGKGGKGSKGTVGIGEQELVIVVWACVSHLKKCVPESQKKQMIKQILDLMHIALQKLYQIPTFNPQSIYPQISSTLMQYTTSPHKTTHKIFQKSSKIFSQLLNKIFPQPSSHSPQQPTTILEKLANKNGKSFQSQCLGRLEGYLKGLVMVVGGFDLGYCQSLGEFVKGIWGIAKRYVGILGVVAVLGLLCDAKLDHEELPSSLKKLVQSSITTQFMTILSKKSPTLPQHSLQLQTLLKLSPHLSPTPPQSTTILHNLTTLFLLHNPKSLILPLPSLPSLPSSLPLSSSLTQSTHLIQLTGQHSFSNYPVGLDGLLTCWQYQCDRLLVVRMRYADMSLGNVGLLRAIAGEVGKYGGIVEELVDSIGDEDGQYMVDMSLTKFYQYVSKILLLYCLTTTHKLPQNLSLQLLQTLQTSQSLRILNPTLPQQQLLISLTILISYQCYKNLCSDPESFPPVRRLKFRLSLLEIVFNWIWDGSYGIRCVCYWVVLGEAAPGSVREYLANLQTTLVNRNVSNLKFIESLLKLGQFSGEECEDLAERFMGRPGSQQLLRILLPRLKPSTIRKCLLSAPPPTFLHLLHKNTHLLHQKPLQSPLPSSSSISPQISPQYSTCNLQNFSMNDGPNVQISNLLGVLLLELGPSWEYALGEGSRFRDLALDVIGELVDLGDFGMVFFGERFVGILGVFGEMLGGFDKNSDIGFAAEKRRYKIYRILQKLPIKNYFIYKKQIQTQPQPKTTPSTSILQQLLSLLQKTHKKYQLNYLTNSNNIEAGQMYDWSTDIIDKLTSVLKEEHEEKEEKEEEEKLMDGENWGGKGKGEGC